MKSKRTRMNSSATAAKVGRDLRRAAKDARRTARKAVRAPAVEVVGPSLHHEAPLREVLRIVVVTTDRI